MRTICKLKFGLNAVGIHKFMLRDDCIKGHEFYVNEVTPRSIADLFSVVHHLGNLRMPIATPLSTTSGTIVARITTLLITN